MVSVGSVSNNDRVQCCLAINYVWPVGLAPLLLIRHSLIKTHRGTFGMRFDRYGLVAQKDAQALKQN